MQSSRQDHKFTLRLSQFDINQEKSLIEKAIDSLAKNLSQDKIKNLKNPIYSETTSNDYIIESPLVQIDTDFTMM
ncbi:470_t:CDS:1, partial [Cetraspora pellucida]